MKQINAYQIKGETMEEDKTSCCCCNRPSKFGCRYCDKTCCEWCYYGGGGGLGHKWRCDYHDEVGPYADEPHKCEQPRCPDPPECDHERPADNAWGEGGLEAHRARYIT